MMRLRNGCLGSFYIYIRVTVVLFLCVIKNTFDLIRLFGSALRRLLLDTLLKNFMEVIVSNLKIV